jgi:hypothetical protein
MEGHNEETITTDGMRASIRTRDLKNTEQEGHLV